jgi:A/G-specific adenine glycosylase
MELKKISKIYRQQLTNQTIEGRFFHLRTKKEAGLKGYKAVNFNELKKLPFPKFITAYLAENGAGHLTDKNVSLNLLY